MTHTFFDSRNSTQKNSLTPNPKPEQYYDFSTAVTCFLSQNSFYSELVIYPLHQQFNYKYQCIFFTEEGEHIFESKLFTINSANFELTYINFKEIISNFNTDKILKSNDIIAQVNFIADSHQIPKRFKLGLNIGEINKVYDLPSNICFGLHYPKPSYPDKKETLRWLPLLQSKNPFFIITNFSIFKNYDKPADITLSFWAADEELPMVKELTIKPNGFLRFNLKDNAEIKKFMNNKTGWVTLSTNNFMVNTWYFADNETGIIGGDHGF